MIGTETSWYFFAFLAALFGALTTIFSKIGLENVNSNLACAIRNIIILVLSWVIVANTVRFSDVLVISPRNMLFLLLSGFATGLSWLCYFRALQLGYASSVAAIDKSSLIMILLLSAVFLDEPLSSKTIIGIFLILLGIIVLTAPL